MSRHDIKSRLFRNVGEVLKVADVNRFLIFSAIGYGICRCCSALPFGAYAVTHEAGVWGDIGKIVGIVLLCWVTTWKKSANHVWEFACLAGVGMALSMLCLLNGMPATRWCAGVALFLVGLGSAAMMLQWLELIARASMKAIAIAIAGAEFLNSVISITIETILLVEPFAFIMLLASTLLLAYCCWGWEFAAPPSSCVGKGSKGFRSTWSWRLAAWVGVYCFAYGLVTTHMGLGTSTFSDSLGNMFPCAVTLIAAIFLNSCFDLKMLKNTAFVFMVAGLVVVGLAQVQGPWVQLLAGAGASSCRLFTYSLACMRAKSANASSIPLCGAAKAIIVVMTDAGLAMGACDFPIDGTFLVVVLTLIVTALSTFMSPFNMDDRRIMEQTFHSSGLENVEHRLEVVAHDAGLSGRETTVFVLMIQGMSTADISDRLFISKSAVRAHQSHVYAKFGIHNQQELVERMRGKMPGF